MDLNKKIFNGINKVFLSSFTHPKDFWFNKIFKEIYQINIGNFVCQLNVTKLHNNTLTIHAYTLRDILLSNQRKARLNLAMCVRWGIWRGGSNVVPYTSANLS